MGAKLKVVKADGVVEGYLHTKVVGTISRALECTGCPDIYVAEELSDVVTYYLYNKAGSSATASEIFSMIKVVLAATGYEEAAAALSEHHCRRRLNRQRTEVISVDVNEPEDAGRLFYARESGQKSRWNKGRIVEDLVVKHHLHRQAARTIASMVEQKVFGLDVAVVPASLVKQLVRSDATAVLYAEEQLQMA